jgi:hypothetical protein
MSDKMISNFGFSHVNIDLLEEAEYTLVVVAADCSSSVSPFCREIEASLKCAVEGCRMDDRSENLVVRVVKFSTTVSEVHGFKPIDMIGQDEYDGCIAPNGMTALLAAVDDAARSIGQYGEILYEEDRTVNGVLFVITDGMENCSMDRETGNDLLSSTVKDRIEAIKAEGKVESLTLVLVGVNTGSQGDLPEALQTLSDEVGMDGYVNVEDASEKSMAKLGGLISQSISASSQALGSGSTPMLPNLRL